MHHRYGPRVIIVSQSMQERVVRLTCPPGMSEGMVMEVLVEGGTYYVTIPRGLVTGMEFDARIPAAAAAPARGGAGLIPRRAPRNGRVGRLLAASSNFGHLRKTRAKH